MSLKTLVDEYFKNAMETYGYDESRPTVRHSRYTAEMCSKIAKLLQMDENKAYAMGLVHDMGRFRCNSFRHSLEGFNMARESGIIEENIYRVCITHMFTLKDGRNYKGDSLDVSNEEYSFMLNYVNAIEYDDYDKLVQLVDILASKNGPCILEKRLLDISLRHKQNEYFTDFCCQLKDYQRYFEEKLGCSIYKIIDKDLEELLTRDV